MTMTKTSAAKTLNAIVSGKEESKKETLDSIFAFCSKAKVTLYDLLNKSNIAKAIEQGLIKAPPADKPKNAPRTQSREPQKGNAGKEDIKEQAKLALAKQEELKAKAQYQKTLWDKMQKTIKANTKDVQPTLFRLTWKEGRKIVGMDVIGAMPVVRKAKPALFGRLLTWDGETLLQANNLIVVDIEDFEFNGKHTVVYDSNGNPLQCAIQFPKEKDKPKQAEENAAGNEASKEEGKE
jgi:hypothetical protein